MFFQSQRTLQRAEEADRAEAWRLYSQAADIEQFLRSGNHPTLAPGSEVSDILATGLII